VRTIIAGGRDNHSYYDVDDAVMASGFVITEVVSGYARGIDTAGEAWSIVNGLGFAKPFPADWDRYGNSAGYRRNAEMADYAEALVAVWDGKSKGTKSMIEIATQKDLEVFVLFV
jgi:hypothetical protein